MTTTGSVQPTGYPPPRPAAPRTVAAALAADVALVLLFAAIGRRSHAEVGTVVGVLATAWPFLAGVIVGWALARAWRAPASLWPAGVGAWVGAVVVGLLLRRATGAGTAASFVVVASVVLGLLLLGWRAAAALPGRRRAR